MCPTLIQKTFPTIVQPQAPAAPGLRCSYYRTTMIPDGGVCVCVCVCVCVREAAVKPPVILFDGSP